jgi:transcriptional regulator with XRE-family HTH domain
MGSSRPHTRGLAAKLHRIRIDLGLSQSQMVERLKEAELPARLRLYAGNVSRFEQGTREPSLLVLLAYARTAGTSIDTLVDANLELPRRMKPTRRNKTGQGPRK